MLKINFSNDIYQEISKHLSVKDFLHLTTCNKKIHKLSKNYSLWNYYIARDFDDLYLYDKCNVDVYKFILNLENLYAFECYTKRFKDIFLCLLEDFILLIQNDKFISKINLIHYIVSQTYDSQLINTFIETTCQYWEDFKEKKFERFIENFHFDLIDQILPVVIEESTLEEKEIIWDYIYLLVRISAKYIYYLREPILDKIDGEWKHHYKKKLYSQINLEKWLKCETYE